MEKIAQRIQNGESSENTIINFGYKINDMKLQEEQSNQEREKLKKDIENNNNKKDIIKKEIDEHNEKAKNFENEKINLNKYIENYNKDCNNFNEYVKEINNLKNNLKINFQNEQIKLEIKNPENKDINLIKPEKISEIEKDINLIIEKEIEYIAGREIEREKEEEEIKIKDEYEYNFKKVVNEPINWENLFNKSVFANEYIYNYDDMKKIGKYNLKKINLSNYYFISDFDNQKNLKKIRKFLKNKKLILGNEFNKENKTWISFCIIPDSNNFIVLFKSSNGDYPSENFKNVLTNILGTNYIIKKNIIKENNDNKFSEVDTIENIKIIAQELSNNFNEFLKNFENYSKFYNENKNKKLYKKKKIYPVQFIRYIYNSIKKRNNNSLISLGLFQNYFINQNRGNEIEIEFLKQIYQILINYKEINNKEKEILTKQYEEISELYYKNRFNANNINNNEEFNFDEKSIVLFKKEPIFDNIENSFNEYVQRKTQIKNNKNKKQNINEIKNKTNNNNSEINNCTNKINNDINNKHNNEKKIIILIIMKMMKIIAI